MRTLCGLVLIVAVGCGGKDNPPPAGEPKAPLTPAGTTGPLAQTGSPGDQAATPKDDQKKDDPKKDEPKTPPAAWEMDPAKHTLPATPAAGSLAKAAFAPTDVEFLTDTLTFRAVTKEGSTRAVALKLPADVAKAAAAGGKVVVKPTDEGGAKVPVVTVELPGAKKDELKVFEYPAGYALTLELGKRDKGSLPGKVYLSLPGDDKDFLAGTFAAEWVRPLPEPPGPDDAPFVQGAVRVAGAKADTVVRVGYVGAPKGTDVPQEILEMPFSGPAGLSGRADAGKPRVTVYAAAAAPDQAGRYEHTHLPAGRYLVFAATKDAPPAAAWVNLGADAKLTKDFTVDAAKVGKLEVKAPAGATGKVLLVPADEGPVPLESFGPAASALGLEAELKDGVARFDRLAPGRYEARLNDLTGTAEVKATETAKLEIAAPKK
jgi:hypothetical protein